MEPVCIIMGAGEYFGQRIAPAPEDYVIAADGGFARLRAMGARVDEVIGDFDSLGYQPDHPNACRLPVEKDDTDMLAALRRGVARGFHVFRLYGGTGGRLDHTLANIQCLNWLARQGLRGYLFGDGCVFTALFSDAVAFEAPAGRTVSVFALGGDAEGVIIEGLKYAAAGLRLTGDFPLGVSNETIGQRAKIAVRQGSLLLCLPEEARIL